ncbi:hypothetical protein [Aquimarina agarilytica]|uniref:hypothetical protein n=1 Tax=Aquimarina agarilytica TaxID=1087449 RepID=UPI000287D317|nr:hypothetical protein [Aquimarina agarilytica]
MIQQYTVKKYNKTHYQSWNTFIENSKNSTFLFHRDFMEYHNDRFEDHSLLVLRKQTIVALVPANKNDTTFYSHQGLTYGGLLLLKSIGVTKVETIFLTIIEYLKRNQFSTIRIKTLPVFYHKAPSFELESLFLKLGAKIFRREQNFAIDYNLPFEIHKTKLKNYKKNQHLNFKIIETDNFTDFWEEILKPRLKTKHNAKPVHTESEILFLKSKFPNNIKQFNIFLENKLLAGITIFKTDTVVKSQYGATTNDGEKLRALEFLFIYLIKKYKSEGYKFFDMGIIAGNISLLKQKEELGCNQYLQDFYQLSIDQTNEV